MVSKNPSTSKLKPKSWFFRYRNHLCIILMAFVLYGLSIRNHYSMDDDMVTYKNALIHKGLNAIPQIFKTHYTEGGGQRYEYRPLVKATFAIEYAIFGENPHISHFLNLLLYIFTCLLLFSILKRLLTDYHPWMPLIATLLFLAHPIHTEVVCSLKNRDELMSFFACLLTLHFAMRYSRNGRWYLLPVIAITYFLSFWSKAGALVFIAVIPLALWFYHGTSWKRILIIVGVIFVTMVIARMSPRIFLPPAERDVLMLENPLYGPHDILFRLGAVLIVLLEYIKLIFFPHPLVFYYGYNMVPLAPLGSFWTVVSLIINLALFLLAIWLLRKKHPLSLGILIYFVCISMYSNIIKPPPGIIAERFLFMASMGFCIVIAWILFAILKISPTVKSLSGRQKRNLIIASCILIVPYTIKTIDRNPDWKDHITLYRHDVEYADKSAKVNSLLAATISDEMYRTKDRTKVNKLAQEAVKYYSRAVEIYPDYSSCWNNLGIIYFRIMNDMEKSNEYFREAIRSDSAIADSWFNLAYNYEAQGKTEMAERLYLKSLEKEPDFILSYSNLANLYFKQGDFDKAVKTNMKLAEIKPESDLPYINIGNYYLLKNDTITAVTYWEKAIEKLPTNMKLCQNLAGYFNHKKDFVKADYYNRLAMEADKKLNEF